MNDKDIRNVVKQLFHRNNEKLSFFGGCLDRGITMTETKACKVVWEKDHELGWRMKVVGDCESLDAVLEAQDPSKKRYLSRRIVARVKSL